MRNKLAMLGIGYLLLSATAFGQNRPVPDVAEVVRDNNDFAFDLYARLAKDEGNLFFSPYSISNALAMTWAGARGNTADEMKATLHFNLDQDRLHAAFGKLVRLLKGDGTKRAYQLEVANRLFGQKDYGFLPASLKIGADDYGAGLEEVDFAGDTGTARKIINAWVEKQTKDKIKELLKPGILTGDSRLVLTNAIYFKAGWLRPFQEKETAPGDFHLAGGKKVKAPLMKGHFRTNFLDDDSFSMLELPYENNDLSMFVLLPKKADGLAALAKQLTRANLEKWLAKASEHMVETTFPKFKTTAEFKLKPVLQEMGMVDAFIRGKADFSGMATREKLFISHVVHKAFVDVNEKGTEAAAATAVIIERESAPPPARFVADHPFLYLLRDRATGSVLFMGRLVEPQ